MQIYTNTILIGFCTRFGVTDYLDEDIVVISKSYQSYPLHYHIEKPAGANKQESGQPFIKTI